MFFFRFKMRRLNAYYILNLEKLLTSFWYIDILCRILYSLKVLHKITAKAKWN